MWVYQFKCYPILGWLPNDNIRKVLSFVYLLVVEVPHILSLRIRVNKRIRIVGLTGDGFSGLKFELMGLAVSSDDQMDSWKGSFQWHRSMVHATCTVEIKAL